MLTKLLKTAYYMKHSGKYPTERERENVFSISACYTEMSICHLEIIMCDDFIVRKQIHVSMKG